MAMTCAFAKLDDPAVQDWFPQHAITCDEDKVPIEWDILPEGYHWKLVYCYGWFPPANLFSKRPETVQPKRPKPKPKTKPIVTTPVYFTRPKTKLTLIGRSKGRQIVAALKKLEYIRVGVGEFNSKNSKRIKVIKFFDHTMNDNKMWIETHFY